METIKQTKKKKLGRPQISDKLKKIRIATYVTPEINNALQNDVDCGKAANLSTAILLILRKHYNI